MKNKLIVLSALFSFLLSFGQSDSLEKTVYPLVAENVIAQQHWVDSLYNEMSLEEKIGQLFMVDSYSSQSRKESDYLKMLIKEYHIGGVIFSKGGPERQVNMSNEFQEAAKIPLLLGMDAEWGLAMRLDSTYAFPWNMTLGAIEDNELIKKTGSRIARHIKRMGMQIDFVPSVDININPNNPVIGNRSFGENKKRVAEKGIALMKGMEEEGILTSAKHFPGHGDTEVDSHHALPLLEFSRERLDSVELYPFRKMIAAGVPGVMVGHMEIPVLDNQTNRPSSLSHSIIVDLLKREMNFKGLVFTDALNMKGVSRPEPGQTSLEAFLAGNDILLIPGNVPAATKKLLNAYNRGKIKEDRLEHSVKKILMAKYKSGLHTYQPIKTHNLIEELNSPENEALYAELMENAITVIKNNKAVLPIKDLDKSKIAYVSFGNDHGNAFFEMLNNYGKVDKITSGQLHNLLEKLKGYDRVIIGFHKSDESPWKDYKFTEKELVWLHEIARSHSVILNIFTRPYAMLDIRSTTNLDGIVISYQNSKIAQEKTAQIIFGAIGAKGKLPVGLGPKFPEGTQFKTRALDRLAYGIPESVGMDSNVLNKIDSIAQVAISEKMTPGMQVLVARKGKVVLKRNYGYQTYDKQQPILDNSIYDLASLTKILTTLPLLMELEDNKELDLDASLSELLPITRGSNKSNMRLLSVLSHQARFKPWLPFYRKSLTKDNKLDPQFYSKEESEQFPIRVAENMYLHRDYPDLIYKEIIDSNLESKNGYKYSDLPFYLFKKYLEDHYKMRLDTLAHQHFYSSIGADHLTFSPKERFGIDQIVPSEVDDYWRKQILIGDVNDQGAAMFGGIGGHAGLFGNANDVAKVMQLFLNNGIYGGVRYFKSETMAKFNTCHFCATDNRRGVGFDKPQLKGPGPSGKYASMNSFGHTGFTGTIAWVDPEEELVYVLLANRIFPDPSNRKFITENIRTKIQDIIYQSIDEPVIGKGLAL